MLAGWHAGKVDRVECAQARGKLAGWHAGKVDRSGILEGV
jgi:hypothetical protein